MLGILFFLLLKYGMKSHHYDLLSRIKFIAYSEFCNPCSIRLTALYNDIFRYLMDIIFYVSE